MAGEERELIFKTLSGLMTQQATITTSMTKVGSTVEVLKSEVMAAKEASLKSEVLFEGLKRIMETPAVNSGDTQKRLLDLESANANLKADLEALKAVVASLRSAS